ncbi:hypothetical protein GCM10023216_00190 [Isoptericola chiayiensis]|uniref:Uncharacterized protein n=1 Tax=Isoptericola chiayiensis TaxID=579446 RepID=A0ABP8XYQ8_9MICO|nr:hypothetical protein [Isoptericola chiayiensis]NOW02177.1 hypothetical protein [Isoptericola chiayiensis]
MRPVLRALALVVSVAALCGLTLAPSAADTDDGASPPDSPLVLAGVSGLQWSDVDPSRTPHLWQLIGGGSVASVAVRTLTPTCPLDAWLTMSAGSRVRTGPTVSADTPEASDDTPAPGADDRGSTGTGCTDVPVPRTDGTTTDGAAPDGVPPTATVPGWDGLLPDDGLVPTGTTPGALGDLVDVAGTCATAVGPGGAVALARDDGSVARYVADVDAVDAALVAACPATVVDLGMLPDDATERGAAVRAVDRQVGALVDALPAGGRLVVAGISDTPQGPSDLQVAVDWTAPGGEATWLTSTSSRWAGVVVLADLGATVADTVTGGALSGTATSTGPDGSGSERSAGPDGGTAEDEDDPLTQALLPFTGSPLERGDERRIPVSTTVENRQYLSVLSETVPRLAPALLGLVALTGLVVAAALVVGRRRRTTGNDAGDDGHDGATRNDDVPAAPPWPWRRVALAGLTVAASLPVAASLATLTRWWAWPSPVMTLLLGLTVAALATALVAWWARRLLPPSPWRLTTCLAAVTWVVLTVDGLTGTTLQQGSLLGPSPSLGARFYGFSNTVFAVYAVAGLLLAAGLAAAARARGASATRAAAVAGVIGVVTVLVDGLPPFGADLGGILALVPGFAVLVLGVAGVRVTWRRAVLLAAVTVGVVVVVAMADWLFGGPSHLGAFVQSVLDGQAVGIVAGKAAGAWATIANPAGAAALVLCTVAAWAALRPDVFRLPGLAEAYRDEPLLRRLVVALVVTAVVGTALNDSGIVVAFLLLTLSVPTLLAGHLEHTGSGSAAGEAAEAADASTGTGPGIRRLPTMLAVLSGAALVLLLLASTALSSAGLRSGTDAAAAGTQVAPSSADAVVDDGPLVVVGTTGVRWDDVAEGRAPTLNGLLADGAGAGGVAQPTGAASRCVVGGWLALSAGTLAEAATARDDDGTWRCADPRPEPTGDGGATVAGWDELVDLQRDSAYQARLGALGTQLAGADCATAVGPRAALALADTDGTVARYRTLDAATTFGGDAYTCPVTVVDAGDATAPAADPDATAEERTAAREADHAAAVADVDATVRQVLATAPVTATVLVVDLAGQPGTRPVLGTALVRAGTDGPAQPRFLTSSATRTDGVARVLDVPATVLGAAGLTPAAPVSDSPVAWGSPRPQDSFATADELADLTTLDHARRGIYSAFVDAPLYAALALAAGCLLLGPRLARAVGARAASRRRTAWAWARGAALVLAALPTGAFLSSLTGWWRFEQPTFALVVSALGTTAVVASVGALSPRRPAWLAPGIIAGITFAVLTLDALVGTPLNRASPLGSAPTFGARFYGFGNPAFSVYAVAALVAAGALAQLFVNQGRRLVAAAAVAGVGVVAMLVDVWPTLGADLGGGLVIAPAFAVLVLAATGARLTFRRFVAVAAAGVGVVAAVGVLDWLRPPDERSHLGNFVAQVIDGEAWETLLRKAGYALRSVLGGAPVWLTLAVLVAAALLLFAPRRFTPGWFARTEEDWPMLRPTVLAIWIVCVAGSVVNDFGVRIAAIALVPAVPLLTVAVLHALWPTSDADGFAPAGRRDDTLRRGGS